MTPILIVDDEMPNRNLLSRLLGAKGYDCTTAADAIEARSCLERQSFPLALCDVSMPGESGLDLARHIVGNFPETAVVMVSGLDNPELANTAMEIGAYGYVVKPFKTSEILIHVTNALHRRALEIENSMHRDRLEHAVKERTTDLRKTIASLEQAEKSLREAHAETDQLVATISSILIAVDGDGKITQWNRVAESTFGIARSGAVGKSLYDCGIQWASSEISHLISEAVAASHPTNLKDIGFRSHEGKERILGFNLNPFVWERDKPTGFLLLGADITERRILEAQLRQSQKMESIGQLAAGIAHEINTPTQYIGDNTRFLQNSFQEVIRILNEHASLIEAFQTGHPTAQLLMEAEKHAKAIDLGYLIQEIPKSIEQSLEGVERVSRIVKSMKEFAHPGSVQKVAADLHKAIESTIAVSRNEWKYVAEMVTDFDPHLPRVPCLLGDFNQVILNLIVNAAHAIADVVRGREGEKGRITISTHCDGPWVEIRVKDTGNGVPKAIQSRIFDPFFTTKEVGKGTGQGLAISHTVVVERHGGAIRFETEAGRGTTFILRLPLQENNLN